LFKEAVDQIAEKHDVHSVTWGDLFKVGRSGQYFPTDGSEFGRGESKTETVRAVEFEEEPKGSGQYVANSGSLAAMLMFMHTDGIESYTCTQWGQSADPASPHHVDQARELYSKRKFKSTWNTLDEVKANLESEKTLQTP
jgi:acyl-homoserine lactone acylase PvdQ